MALKQIERKRTFKMKYNCIILLVKFQINSFVKQKGKVRIDVFMTFRNINLNMTNEIKT